MTKTVSEGWWKTSALVPWLIFFVVAAAGCGLVGGVAISILK